MAAAFRSATRQSAACGPNWRCRACRRLRFSIPKRLLNAGAFMMIGGRVLPSVRYKRAYRAHEPDIDRAAEGLSRAASAAIAGTPDAALPARHPTPPTH